MQRYTGTLQGFIGFTKCWNLVQETHAQGLMGFKRSSGAFEGLFNLYDLIKTLTPPRYGLFRGIYAFLPGYDGLLSAYSPML